MFARGVFVNKAVRNEQRKLTATFVNGIAIAAVAIGALAQAAAMVQSETISLSVSLFVVICVIIAVILHLLARASLRGMED